MKMRRRRKSHEVIKVGNIAIPIYQTAKGFTAKWEVGGKKHRVDRVFLVDIRNKIKEVATNLDEDSPTLGEDSLRKKLAYYLDLETRMNGTPLDVAVDAYLLSHKRISISEASLAELVDEFVESRKGSGVSSAYVAGLSTYLKILTGKLGDCRIHKIHTDDLSKVLLGAKGELRYRQNIRAAWTTFFRWARDEKKALAPNSLTEADLIGKIKVKRKKAEIYTPDEMKALLRATDGSLRHVIVLSGFCGIRTSEITGEGTDHPPLPAEEILFEHHQIRVGEQKIQSKGDRFAPLLPNAAEWLSALKSKKGPIWTLKAFPYRIAQACKKAEVEFKRNALRKSWITYRMAIVKNANQVADEAGNSPAEIYRSYRRPELIQTAEAWFSIFPLGTLPTR